jgi:UDP-glucose 4-epimerase
MHCDSTEAYRGSKVLVTGGSGFIGLNLVARLVSLNADVTIYDYAMSRAAEEMAEQNRERLRLCQGDIRDEAKVEEVVRGKDFLFDLAGKSGAADSNKSALLDLDVNCRGHLTLFEACRRVNQQVSIVFPSSRLVYGRPQYLPVDEDHPLQPESFYAVHKTTVEHYLQVYAKQYGIRSTILRISNPYGPLQGHDERIYGVANKFIQAAVENQAIRLFGDGEQKRDYVYIDDLIDALLKAGVRASTPPLIVNIGGDEAVSLQTLSELIVRLAGSGSIEHVSWPDEFLNVETGDYRGRLDKAKEMLDWQPATSLEDGIRKTIKSDRKE